jgi:hypothetical protein
VRLGHGDGAEEVTQALAHGVAVGVDDARASVTASKQQRRRAMNEAAQRAVQRRRARLIGLRCVGKDAIIYTNTHVNAHPCETPQDSVRTQRDHLLHSPQGVRQARLQDFEAPLHLGCRLVLVHTRAAPLSVVRDIVSVAAVARARVSHGARRRQLRDAASIAAAAPALSSRARHVALD